MSFIELFSNCWFLFITVIKVSFNLDVESVICFIKLVLFVSTIFCRFGIIVFLISDNDTSCAVFMVLI